MCELIVLVTAIVAVYKIADVDEQSGFLWASLTLLMGLAGLFLLPGLPFIRVGIAFGVALVGMLIYKIAANR